jgi:hypothetical protein
MRPEKAYAILWKIFDNATSINIIDQLSTNKLLFNAIEKVLEKAIINEYQSHIYLISNVESLRGSVYKEEDMYYEHPRHMSDESIINTLDYISDRFNCVGRLKWLLELAKFLRAK